MEVDLNRKVEHLLNNSLIEKFQRNNKILMVKEGFTTRISHQAKYLQKS